MTSKSPLFLIALLGLGCGASTEIIDQPEDGSSEDGSPSDGHGGDGDGDGQVGDGDGDGDGQVGDGDGQVGDGDGDGQVGDGDGDGPYAGYFGEGVITPSHKSREQLVSETVAFYQTFKANFIEPACESGHYRVRSAGDTQAHTVSEAHGYGMLFAVLMADHDSEARTIFDGMSNYALAHESLSGIEGLMAWAQDEACNDIQGGNAATDGDLDIAYALWLAHEKWGSDGAVNYRQRAETVLRGILEGEIADQNHIMIGDWVGEGHWRGTRPSDWMTSHLKSFAEQSGETRWNAIVDRTYEIGKLVQDGDSTVGLLPDFVDGADSSDPWPAHGDWLEGQNDGNYGYNACRVPWRLATDYLMSGDPRARDIVRKLNAFIRQASGDNPNAIVDGYTLTGQPYGSWPSPAFVAPFMVAAMVEPESGTNQEWLDIMWDAVTSMEAGRYYGDSIKLATMMVVAGMWKTP